MITTICGLHKETYLQLTSGVLNEVPPVLDVPKCASALSADILYSINEKILTSFLGNVDSLKTIFF